MVQCRWYGATVSDAGKPARAIGWSVKITPLCCDVVGSNIAVLGDTIMLRCTMCGSALLPNAQFCGVCGNGMNNVSSLDRPTDIASTAHRNVQESDIITAPGQFSPLLRLPTNR